MAKTAGRGGSAASKVTYLNLKGKAKARKRVYGALYNNPAGLTNHEVADLLDITMQSVAGRRFELMEAGKVFLTGRRRKTKHPKIPELRPKDMDDRIRLIHEALDEDEASCEPEESSGPLSSFWSHRSRRGVSTQEETE